jgi:hypothetical protein
MMKKMFAATLVITIMILGSVTTVNSQDASSLPERFRCVLVGKIDNQFPIQVELNRIGDDLIGRYFYERKRDGNYLSLRGKLDQTGAVALSEYDGDKETGKFNGKLTREVIDGESNFKLAGTWTSLKDAKEVPVELVEQRFNLGDGLKIASKEQRVDAKAEKVGIVTAHPQLSGGGPRVENFNKTMNDFVGQRVAGFRKELQPENKSARPAADSGRPAGTLDVSYKVLYADRNLVSLIYTTYTYTGGAHGNAASASFNYDLKNGKMLTLADLFTPNSGYLTTIAEHCINAIKQRNISDEKWIRGGAGPDRKNYLNWNIVPQGLLITFDAYQVAAYAAGPQEVVVPYSALKEMIKPGGPLAAFVN